MMKHRVFLPTAGVVKPRTDYDWDGNNMRVQQEVEPFPEGGEPVVIGLSSFGIGGSYGHVVIEEYRPPAKLIKASDATAAPHAVAEDGAPRPFDLPWVVLDSGKAARVWGWRPATPVQTVLEEIAGHAEANPGWLDLSAPL